jgi:hypothetical protein
MNALKSLKRVRIAISVVGIIGMALLILYGITQIQLLLKISFGVLAGASVIWVLAFRCPSCGDSVHWLSIPEYCKGCGKRFEDMNIKDE